jgi:hypothetical protein
VSWFPDGERFLVTADGGGDELNHIYVGDGSGELQDLTPGENVKRELHGLVSGSQSQLMDQHQ